MENKLHVLLFSFQLPHGPMPSFFEKWEPTVAKRRTTIPPKPLHRLNLWSIMKNCIGKDLSRIPMPVSVFVCTCVRVCSVQCGRQLLTLIFFPTDFNPPTLPPPLPPLFLHPPSTLPTLTTLPQPSLPTPSPLPPHSSGKLQRAHVHPTAYGGGHALSGHPGEGSCL